MENTISKTNTHSTIINSERHGMLVYNENHDYTHVHMYAR
jgi:hypothetical protein